MAAIHLGSGRGDEPLLEEEVRSMDSHPEQTGPLEAEDAREQTITWTMILAISVGPIGGFAIGWDTALIGIKIISLSYQMALSEAERSAVLVVVPVCTMISGVWSGHYCNEHGRIPALKLAAWLLMLGAAIAAEAYSFWPIFLGRGLIGTAFGFILTACPVYVSECAPDRHRGKLVVLFEFCNSVATWAAFVAALTLQSVLLDGDANPATPKGWRLMAGSVGLPGVALLLVTSRIPESARWHVMRGENEEAGVTLKALRSNEYEAQQELAQMIDGFSRTPGNTGYGQLLFTPDAAARRAFELGSVLSCLFALVQLLSAFCPMLLIKAGFSVDAMLWIQIINQCCRTFASAWALSAIDSWGRRPVLLLVFSLGFIGFVLLTVSIIMDSPYGIAVGIILVYLGRAVQPRGVEVELFPIGLRASGKGWTSAVVKATQAVVMYSTLIVVGVIGWTGLFSLHAVASLIGVIYVARRMPETKNKSLEVIEKQLRLGTIETPPVTPFSTTPTTRSRENSTEKRVVKIFKTESVDISGGVATEEWNPDDA